MDPFSKDPREEMKANVSEACYAWDRDANIWKRVATGLKETYLAPSVTQATGKFKGIEQESIFVIGRLGLQLRSSLLSF